LRIIASLIENFVLAFIFASIFILPQIFRRKSDEPSTKILFLHLRVILENLAFNLSLLVSITFLAAQLDINIKALYYIFALLFGIGIFRQLFDGEMRKSLTIRIKIILVSIGIAMWAELPAIIKSANMGSGLNMTSIGNNDVVAYALTASEFLKNGFRNTGHLANMDLNAFSRDWQHQVPNVISSFVAGLSNLYTWQIMTVVMILAIGLSALAVHQLIEELNSNLNYAKSLAGAAIVVLSPLLTYIYGNYFLGQAFSISIGLITVARFARIGKSQRIEVRDMVSIASLTVLSIYAYPIFLLPLLAVSMTLCLTSFLFKNRNNFIALSMRLIASVVIGALISFPYIPIAWRIVRTLSHVASGWPLPPLNPVALFIYGKAIGYKSSAPVLIVSWLVPILVWLVWIQKSKIEKRVKHHLVLLNVFLAISFLTIIVIKRDPADSYQSWKLLSYFFPIVYSVTLAFVLSQHQAGKILGSLLLACGLAAPFFQWSAVQKIQDMAVSANMIEVSKNPQIQRLTNLNLDLRPYFESMAMAEVIQKPKIFINSQQYFPLKQDPSACTLIRSDNRRYVKALPINKEYSLVPAQNGNCKLQNADFTWVEATSGSLYTFSSGSNGTSLLVSGWSSPEPWGTWTDGKTAKISFRVRSRSRNYMKLTIQGNEHLPKISKSLKIEYYLNNSKIGLKEFSNLNVGSDTVFTVTDKILLQSSLYTLTFKIINPVSPLSDHLSGDSRELGFGITGLKIDY
jgi:hypothetical protein